MNLVSRFSHSRAFFVAALAAVLLTVSGIANADPVPGPGGVDYGALATSFSDAIKPIMTTVLPVGVVILGIWMAPRLLKRLVKLFAGG